MELTLEEAEAFRTRLIREVYPELDDRAGYLADDGLRWLARGLGVPESAAWERFDPDGGRSPLVARGIANVLAGRSEASPEYQESIWEGLWHLVESAPAVDPELVGRIAEQRGGPDLEARLCRGRAAVLTGRRRGRGRLRRRAEHAVPGPGGRRGQAVLWKLLHAGFDVYGFVHDEVLINLPAGHPDGAAERAVAIQVAAMEEVLEGLPAACHWSVGDCWRRPD